MKIEYNEERLLSLKGFTSSPKYGVDLILKYPDRFDFYNLSCKVGMLPASEIKKIAERIHWSNFFSSYEGEQFFNKEFDFIIENRKKIGLYTIVNILLTGEQLEKLFKKNDVISFLKGRNYIRLKNITVDLIEKYEEYLNWQVIPHSYYSYGMQKEIITLDFARKYSNKINWRSFTKFYVENNEITEELLKEFSNRLDLAYILTNKQLTENMLNIIINSGSFGSHMWDIISEYQEFSEEFFIQNLFKLNFHHIRMNARMQNCDFLEVEMKNETIGLLLKLNGIKVVPTFEK